MTKKISENEIKKMIALKAAIDSMTQDTLEKRSVVSTRSENHASISHSPGRKEHGRTE